MTLIKTGAQALDFSLKNSQGEIVNLSDFRGKKVLLSWHPLAWTSVCTDQMRSLEANYDRFEEANTVALGLSVDAIPGKAAWAAVLSLEKTSLLCDFWPHGKVAAEYGIFNSETGTSERVNILIDESGTVVWMKIYPMSQLPDINEIFPLIEQ